MIGELVDDERFWGRVARTPDGCWLWTGTQFTPAPGKPGYGRFYVANRSIRAHRYAWLATHGPIPEDLRVCHECDTPLCCRPSHLFLGTTGDNVRDKFAKGRAPQHSPTCKHGHPWDERNTHTLPSGKRRCRTCARDRKRKERHRA